MTVHTERFVIEQAYKQPLTSLRKYECLALDPEVSGSREAIIKDILSGEITVDQFTTIWHASSTEPLRDVTAEIAEEVLNRAEADLDDDGIPTLGSITDFIEQNITGDSREYAAEKMGAV